MVRRIKPVSRALKTEACVRRPAAVRALEREALRSFATWGPGLDVSVTEAEVVVSGELPGVEAEDVEVVVTGNRLELRGVKRETDLPPGARFLRLEREFGRFRRIVLLPASVDPERASGTLENGVLTIRLPKAS
ncbi:MAG: Hsp20/alpha crystallin family protein [Candidatus Aminicenantes bacterium]|nr:Hsp20/alpha crystallin family protein [Candidatus Aminicenantes bacterium]